MKRHTTAALLALLMLLLVGCNGTVTYSLRVGGTVTDQVTAFALSGVSIEATVQGKAGLWTDTSDSSGQYSISITGLRSTSVITLKFSHHNYEPWSRSFAYPGSTYLLNAQLTGTIIGDTLGGYASLMNIVPPSSSISNASVMQIRKPQSPVPQPVTEVIIAPKAGTRFERIQNSISSKGSAIKEDYPELGFLVVPIPKGKSIEGFMQEIRDEGWCDYVEPNSWACVSAYTVPNDEYFANYQWNMYATSMPYAWGMPDFGDPMVIAVLDTGVDVTHPDLEDRTLPPLDMVYGPSHPSYTLDIYGHGTHVAGIIGAIVNNSMYMSGMNNRAAAILPVKVLGDRGGGYATDIAAGIKAAADGGADIISMSLGFKDDLFNQSVADQIAYAQSKNVVLVAAAGNSTLPRADFPANQPNVVTVSSINPSFSLSDFSNYGSEIDFAAPGGEMSPEQGVWSLYPVDKGQVASMLGTSQATPHVTALIAMLMQQGFNKDQALDMMGRTAQYNDRSQIYYGNGIINAYAALNGLTMDRAIFWLADLDEKPVVGKAAYGSPDRSFELPSSIGTYLLRGWVDANGNLDVDDGDYYGSETVSLGSGGSLLDHVFEMNIVIGLPMSIKTEEIELPRLPAPMR